MIDKMLLDLAALRPLAYGIYIVAGCRNGKAKICWDCFLFRDLFVIASLSGCRDSLFISQKVWGIK
jgi:hypothetical protein